MSGICRAGNRQGLKCDHKRNMGDGIVACGTDLPCSERETKKAHEDRLKSRMAEVE